MHKQDNVIESLMEFENCPKAVINEKPDDMVTSKTTDDVKNQNLSITGHLEVKFENVSKHTCPSCDKVFTAETSVLIGTCVVIILW